MLDLMTAKKLKNTIDDHINEESITLEDVMMSTTLIGKAGEAYNILAIQYKDLTILIRIVLRQDGIQIHEIRTEIW